MRFAADRPIPPSNVLDFNLVPTVKWLCAQETSMNRFNRKTASTLLILLMAAVSALLLSRAYFVFQADRIARNEKTIESYSRAMAYDPSNAEYLWSRGRLRQYSLEARDIPGAIRDYEQALALNPRIGQAWLDLAECFEAAGDSGMAEKALQNGIQVWTYSPSLRWQAGNFYLMRGDLPKMYECFRMAIQYDTNKLGIAIRIAWKADADHAAIHRKLIPDILAARLFYFNYLVDREELDLAREVWDACLKMPIPGAFEFKPAIAFSYIDKLLAKSRVEDAVRVWNEALRKAGINADDNRFVRDGEGVRPSESSTNLVWNGSFETDILGGGFDWRNPETPGVRYESDLTARIDGLRSLKLVFDGTTNIDSWHPRQIVPTLAPGNYLLEFCVKCAGITTDQRPYFVVQGFPDAQGAGGRSEPFPENSEWRKYSVPFVVKPGTRAVELVLRRGRSQKFDNLIKGSLWLDNVSVRHQPQPAAADAFHLK